MNRQDLIQIFMQKNSQLNLSAIRNPEGIFVKHIQDSLEVNWIIKFPKWNLVLDVWTGSWFPLLPLAMTNPDTQLLGIESIWKKVKAVNDMISQLSISNAEVVRWRAENIKLEKKADFVVARAVAYVDKLLDWTQNLIKSDGKRILMKKVDEEEKKILLNECKKRKIKLIWEYRYKLFVEDIWRVIYVIQK